MMTRRMIRGCPLALMLAVLIGPAQAAGQGNCLPEDDRLESLYGYSLKLGTNTDEFFADRRAAYNIPLTTASEVERVFDNDICKSASQTYKRELGLPGERPDVYVVRIGTRYVVVDPNTKGGEFSLYLVLDMSFNKVGGWGG